MEVVGTFAPGPSVQSLHVGGGGVMVLLLPETPMVSTLLNLDTHFDVTDNTLYCYQVADYLISDEMFLVAKFVRTVPYILMIVLYRHLSYFWCSVKNY